MSRFRWTATCALAGLVLSSSCELPLSGPSTPQLAELRVSALVVGTPIDLLVVRVTASDIPTPLVFNLAVQNGVAQGTIRLPPGTQRIITVDAYDSDGDITAEGTKTIDVKPGQNPPVSIPVVSKAGQVTITVTLGPVSVVVQPTAPTVQVGAALQLSVTITAANGDVLAGPAEWATTDPAVATVDQHGSVTGVMPGGVDIVATFAGVAGVSHVTVASQITFSQDGVISLVNADGSGLLPLASGQMPSWSPDGTRLAFACRRDFNDEICVVNADGTSEVRLTPNNSSNFDPAWSPNGAKIAFESSRDGDYDIHLMNADGSGVVNVTNSPGFDFEPTWSPDGMKIAFASDRTGLIRIFVMNADGTQVRRLTDADDSQPAWSPDGTKIAFTSTRDGNFHVYVMNADGTNVTRLTEGDALDWEPAWSPDGTKIAFTSDRAGGHKIFVMNADGTGVTLVPVDVSGSGIFDTPRWRP